MITQGQRITIAVLIPLALISVGLAVYTYVSHVRNLEQREQERIIREKVERGRVRMDRKPPEDNLPPEEEKRPGLHMPRDLAEMETGERAKLAADTLAILGRAASGGEERYRACVSLMNCRRDAVAPLLDALKSDNAQLLYYALKACADLKELYRIDDAGFLDAALAIKENAPADVKMQAARLLGLYRDDRAVARLENLAADDGAGVQYRALLSLARAGRRSSAPVIARALYSERPEIQAAAVRAMDAVVGYSVGGEFTTLRDYFGALARETRKWRSWWEKNKGDFDNHSQ